MAMGNLQKALACFKRTISLEPSHVNAHINTGQILRQLNRNNEGIPHLIKATEIAPGIPLAWFELALSHMAAGDPIKTTYALTRTVNIDPKFANASEILARVQQFVDEM